MSKLAAQEKRQLLSRLLARFAHEVRNPLSSLNIHLQLLEEDFQEAPPRLREKSASRFEIIQGELHRLEGVVRHFLSLAGPSSLELQAVDPGRIAGHVCELLRPEAAARDIDLQLDLAEGLPHVPADPGQLTQALVNLVINAIQAVGRDGWVQVQVQVRAGSCGSATGSLAIQVMDTGPGIPPGRESAIFEPFFTTKSEGSGLGLWIVQQIITAHGGEVEASNRREGGALFTVQIPLQRKEPQRG